MGIVSRKFVSRYIIPCVFAACIIGFLFSSCAMYDPVAFGFAEIGDEAELKTTSATQVTIEWDPPASPVKSYRIYYREHDAVLWIFLTEIPAADDPQHIIDFTTLGPGTFDFGVSAVDYSDQESDIHTSLDVTADPSTGWYLLWKGG
jgi:hypothetical protein